jgi:hypothetical protein
VSGVRGLVRLGGLLGLVMTAGCCAQAGSRPVRPPVDVATPLPKVKLGIPDDPREYLPAQGVVLRFREETTTGDKTEKRDVEIEVIAEGEGEVVVVQRALAAAAPAAAPGAGQRLTPGGRAGRGSARGGTGGGGRSRKGLRPTRKGSTFFVVRYDDTMLRSLGDPEEARPLLPWPPDEGVTLAPEGADGQGSAGSPEADGGSGSNGSGSDGGASEAAEGPRLKVLKGHHPCKTPDGPRDGCVEVEFQIAANCYVRELYAPGLFHVRAEGTCGEQHVKVRLLSVARHSRGNVRPALPDEDPVPTGPQGPQARTPALEALDPVDRRKQPG